MKWKYVRHGENLISISIEIQPLLCTSSQKEEVNSQYYKNSAENIFSNKFRFG